jgi:predicted AAA+ superfamily ATPase
MRALTLTAMSQHTAKAWLSILEASFIAFRLQSWHGNLGKRRVEAPKLSFHRCCRAVE